MGTALKIQQRFTDIDGRFAASAIALTLFVSLFPLLLVTIAIVAALSGSNQDLGNQIISRLGLTGDAANAVHHTLARGRESSRAGSIIGLLGLTWSGLSVVAAVRHGVNLPWGAQTKSFKSKLLGVPWMIGGGLILVVSIALTAVVNWLPGWTAPLAIAVSLGIDTAFFLWTFWFLATERQEPRSLLPGAILGAVGFEILKLAGTVVVPRLVASSSAVYGSLGMVFAILAWLALFGRLLVYSSVFNAVRADAVNSMSGADTSTRAASPDE